MDEKLNLYIDKLKIKNNKLNEIFKYVSSKNFKISEDEVQHIENYLNKREKLYNELMILEKELKSMRMSDEQKSDHNVILIVNKNDELIKSILQHDEKNKKKLEQISNILRGNIKSIKNTGKASNRYFGIYNAYSEGNYFDSKR